ncbi:TetR/AcrR family transcriptional regulator [Ktedonospora formicarum]|nr:TetR/AcrR family transcriptional regulator [Ktedonospora formicarum]
MNTHRPDALEGMESGEEGPRRRPGGRSARVQAAAYDAVIALVQERGYEALSLAAIAERAGVHESSLYRRWGTREQLLLDAISSRAAREVPIPDTGALRSDLIELLRLVSTFLQTAEGQALVRTGVATAHIPAFRTFHQEYWQQRHIGLHTLFQRAIERGELAPETDCQLLLETLIGVFYVRAFLLAEPLPEILPERVVDLILPGAQGR